MNIKMIQKLLEEKKDQHEMIYKEFQEKGEALNIETANRFNKNLELINFHTNGLEIKIALDTDITDIFFTDKKKLYDIRMYHYKGNFSSLEFSYSEYRIKIPDKAMSVYAHLLSWILQNIDQGGCFTTIIEKAVKQYITLITPLNNLQEDILTLEHELHEEKNRLQEENFNKNCIEGAILIHNAKHKEVAYGFKIKRLLPKTVVYDTVVYDSDTEKLVVNENEDSRMKIDRFKKDYAFADDYYWMKLQGEDNNEYTN